MANGTDLQTRREARLRTPTSLGKEQVDNITAELNVLCADVFALYIKTKGFHWHISGVHFRDYHLLLDDQADQILAMIDPIAERVRKMGRNTIHSIGHAARLKHVADNDADYVDPLSMLAELREDSQALLARMIQIHDLCDDTNDVGTASLLETWIDETQGRVWFLFETGRR